MLWCARQVCNKVYRTSILFGYPAKKRDGKLRHTRSSWLTKTGRKCDGNRTPALTKIAYEVQHG